MDDGDPAASPAGGRDGLNRLHPAAIPLGFYRAARSWLLPVFVLLVLSRGSTGGGYLQIAGLGLLLSLGATVLHFVSVRFGIVGDRFLLRSGLLFRQVRTIPLSRIQNVELEQDVARRILGVVEVRIETAGGTGQTEAHLTAVSLATARELRETLLGFRAGIAPREAPAEIPLLEITRGELLLAGATANRIGVIVASLFGLLEFGSDLGTESRELAGAVSSRLLGAGASAQTLLAIFGALLVVLAGWMVSIVSTFVQHHGFRLSWTSGGLRRRHGLLTRFEGTIPLHRIQALRIERSWPRRLLSHATLRADTAGSAKEKEQAGTALLFPITPDTSVPWFVRLVFPELALDQIDLSPVHPLARRRSFVRLALLGILGSASLVWWRGPGWWVLAAAWLPVAAWLAHRRYQVLGYTVTAQHLVSQFGLWTRRTWIVPLRKIQAVSIVAGPMQRHLGLATLVVANASHGSAATVTIVDLAATEAARLADFLSRESARTASRREGV